MIYRLVTLSFFFLIYWPISTGGFSPTKEKLVPIHPYVKYYEPLNYERLQSPGQGCERQKRDGDDGVFVLKVNFKAFKRNFKLSLSRNTRLFAQGASLSVVGEKNIVTNLIKPETTDVYKGILEDEPTSTVHGHLTDGIFEGVIKTDTEIYHTEPADRYLNDTPGFHSVIYKARDVKFSDAEMKEPCGLQDGVRKKLHKMQMDTRPIVHGGHFEQYPSNRADYGNIFDGYDEIPNTDLKAKAPAQRLYNHKTNNGTPAFHAETPLYNGARFSRTRRAAGKNVMRTCPLYLVADHTFYKDVAGSSSSKALKEMLYHIQEADDIFRAADFDQDGVADNIGFSVAGATVFEHAKSPYYTMPNTRDGIEDVLNQFSEYNFNRYCLGVLFTFRDFRNGVLGLAWIGYSTWHGPAGGICQYRVKVRADNKDRNLNTAVITLQNFGKRLPMRISAVTLTHELGHSFGAPHDPISRKCSPGGDKGNYLMYSMATGGNQHNNHVFSECSKMSIESVVDAKGNRCLQVYVGPQCGNGIVEEGEVCDCGTAAECPFTDNCCTPLGGRGSSRECTFKEGANCSPRMSVCCSESCVIISKSKKNVCQEGTECVAPSYCNGLSPSCPDTVFHPNGTVCGDDGDSRCYHGECTLTPCFDIGLEDCLCDHDPSTFCHLCCKVNETCVSAESLGLVGVGGSTLFSAAGHACANYTGYCSEYGMCISVDNENALNKLRALLTDEQTGRVQQWFKNNWYYIVAIIVALGVIAIVVRFSYKKKSSPSGGRHEQERLSEEAVKDIQLKLEDIHAKIALSVVPSEAAAVNSGEQSQDEDNVELSSAVKRLASIFPTADPRVLIETVKISMSEEDAIKALLLQGYPMRGRYRKIEQ